MVRKKLAAVVAAFGALQADVAGALGLGEFTLNSALNQPLNAQIRLLNTEDLDKTQIIIKLASTQDFENAGVIRDFFLTNLRFAVELDGQGNGVIRVTSREPVIEPYLDLMVEARWPNGRLLREYTVLLDLPVFSDSQASTVSASVQQQVTPKVTVQTQAPSAPAPVSAAPASTASSVAVLNENRKTLTEGQLQPGQNYRVRRDDTLWEIATKARPARSVSLQQTMVGIQRNNPEAFINGNINRLKAGAVLRLPTEQEVKSAVSRNQAVSEVAEHNRSWKTEDELPATAAPLQAAATEPEVAETVEEEARLTIAAAGEGIAGGADQVGSGTSGGGTGGLRDELVQSQESLEEARLENNDLNTRLTNLEAKLATMQRLLELKDDQLAALQAGAADSLEQQGQQPILDEGGLSDAEPGSTDENLADQAADDEVTTEVSSAATDDQQAGEKAKAEEKPTIPKAKISSGEKSFIDQLLENPLYAVTGAVIALLLLFFGLRRRKSEEEPETVQQAVEPVIETETEEEVVATLDEEEVSAEDEELRAEVIEQLSEQQEQVEEATETVEKVTSETGDAIAEADIYIAYGRYQQAKDLLTSTIEESPSSELRLKLLEVCVETRDKDGFIETYNELKASGDEESVAQAKELLSTADDVAHWLDEEGEGHEVESTDIEGSAEPEEASEESVSEEESSESEALTQEPVEEEVIEDDPAEIAAQQEQEEQVLDADIEAELEAELDEELKLGTEKFDSVGDSEIELDLDLDLGEDLEEVEVVDSGLELSEDLSEVEGLELDDSLELDTDLEFETEAQESSESDSVNQEDELELDLNLDLDADLDDLSAGADMAGLAAEFDVEDAAEESVVEVESEVSVEAGDTDGEANQDEEYDFLADTDEVATKLDLARAYIDMGDSDGAKEILAEVQQGGSNEQKQEASELLEKI